MLARGVPSSSRMIIVPARAVYLIVSPPMAAVCDVVDTLSFQSAFGALSASFFSADADAEPAGGRSASWAKAANAEQARSRAASARFMGRVSFRNSLRDDGRSREAGDVAQLVDDADGEDILSLP